PSRSSRFPYTTSFRSFTPLRRHLSSNDLLSDRGCSMSSLPFLPTQRHLILPDPHSIFCLIINQLCNHMCTMQDIHMAPDMPNIVALAYTRYGCYSGPRAPDS